MSEVDGCWVSECKRLRLLGGGADRVGEDKQDVRMDVLEVSASEVGVLHDVVMVVVAVDVVHAGVIADVTVREEEEEEEGRQWRQWMLACVKLSIVWMVCFTDQYIPHVNANYPGSVHDAFVLRNSSIPNGMGQLQRHTVWLIGDSGYLNLSWLLTPVKNARTRAEERYNEAHGRTRRIIERIFGFLKARFRYLPLTGGALCFSPAKVCQKVLACCMLHNLALRRHVPLLQVEETGDDPKAAIDPVDSEDEKA
ncbi:hypothetical protein NDU88_002082 [Pleurodeles waltl]|uniref:DDE Tnp4 domain-containing protein n=1 Tax=Pleurodeles waltl TaxID=8319 RepID=A0AAV7M0G0_PLEWA|nr:hypothetical protein NDU88_002082 [Pleurodeles waltl]